MRAVNKGCVECKYWVAPTKGALSKRGECRRNAPVIGVVLSQQWPKTRATDWCGDYRARPKETLTRNGG